jgi:hypothetical protein
MTVKMKRKLNAAHKDAEYKREVTEKSHFGDRY